MKKGSYMINNKKRQALLKIVGSACALSLCMTSFPVQAAPTIKELEQKTSDLESKVKDMNSKLASLSKEVEEASKKVAEKEAEVDKVGSELSVAIQNEYAQYDAMKKRIKFMYEGGDVSLIEILLTSENMGDFLNRAEYVSTISDYDRDMLETFKAIRADIDEKQEALRFEEAELKKLQDELAARASVLENSLSSSNNQLAKYKKQLKDARIAEAIAVQRAYELQKAREEAARKAAEAAKKDSQNDAQPGAVAGPLTGNESTDWLKSLGTFKITHYCNCKICCGKWSGGNTASGTYPTEGRTIAVDPSVIPLGSRVVINGVTFIAEDTGKAIKGNRIDIYVNNHVTALNYGTYNTQVYLK